MAEQRLHTSNMPCVSSSLFRDEDPLTIGEKASWLQTYPALWHRVAFIKPTFCEFFLCPRHVLGALQEITLTWETKWVNRNLQYHVVISTWQHIQSARETQKTSFKRRHGTIMTRKQLFPFRGAK